jgi:hypothetical protein
VGIVAAHGVIAAVTVVLVLLAALDIGGSLSRADPLLAARGRGYDAPAAGMDTS